MKIQKSKTTYGMYNCSGYINGKFYVGAGFSLVEALEEMFKIYHWSIETSQDPFYYGFRNK